MDPSAGADSVMVAADSAGAVAGPQVARRRMVRLAVMRMRRRETVVAALKVTALRSTMRLSTGPKILLPPVMV